MFDKQMKKGFMSMVLIVGVLDRDNPVFAGTSESIIGAMANRWNCKDIQNLWSRSGYREHF